MTKIYVTLPIDMLWVDMSEDDFNADATETAFADTLRRKLYEAGYEVEIDWGNVAMTRIENEDGSDLGDDYHHIHGIMDSIEVDYIPMDVE